MKIYMLFKKNNLLNTPESKCDLRIEDIPLCDMSNKFELVEIIKQCVRKSLKEKEDQILFCKSSSLFDSIHWEQLSNYIKKSTKLCGKVVLFNATGVDIFLPISSDYFWVNSYIDSDLFLLDSSLFDKILLWESFDGDQLHTNLSKLTNNKLLINPMLGISPSPESSTILKKMSYLTLKNKKIQQQFEDLKKFILTYYNKI